VSCPLKLVAGVPTSDSPFTVTVPLSKSPMLRQHTLGDYIAGVDTDEIARRHGVSHATASNIAARHGVLRNPHHSRDELVERIVGWFVGRETTARHGTLSPESAAEPASPACVRWSTSTPASLTTSCAD
jgi:hypothetical protein